MSAGIYADVVIKNDQFTIVKNHKPSFGNGPTLAALRRIEKVMRLKLQYSNNIQDEYAKLSKEELWNVLYKNAKLIHDRYIQNDPQTLTIKKITQQKRNILSIYNDIEKLATASFTFDLPTEIIHYILNFLSFRDVTSASQVNKYYYELSKKVQVNRAREYGYLGLDFFKAKKDLMARFCGIHTLAKYRHIPRKYIVITNNFLGFGNIDSEATLWKIKNLKTEENRTLKIKFNKALIVFIRQSHVEAVSVLLDYGANPNTLNQRNRTPLYFAMTALQINKEVIALLLKHRADPNIPGDDGYTPLCINTQFPEITELLCKNGANVNHQTNFQGYNALHFAAEKGQLETVRVLLKYGANPNLTNIHGKTALHSAMYGIDRDATRLNKELILLLLTHGANPNIADSKGYTPICINTQHPEITELLCKNGANVNHQINNRWYSALHFAAQKGYLETVEILLNCGANPNLMNFNGRMPLHLAKSEEIKKILASASRFPS